MISQAHPNPHPRTGLQEAAHALLKRYIISSQGDLFTTWRSIEQALANQIQNIKIDAAKEYIRTPLRLDQYQYHACFGYITATALRLVQDNYNSAIKAKSKPSEPLKPCTGVFNTITGLPCAHQIQDIRNQGISLLPEHFHKHWYWDRYLDLPEPTLEPLRTITNYMPRTHSTRRLPSGFEATEDRERRYGLCHLPGHTRASQRCPVNIRRLQEEYRPQLTSSSASLFVPRAAVQSLLDSAGQSTLRSALQSVLDSGDQLILKSTIQSILESTSQPIPRSTSQPVPELTPESTIQPVPELTPESTIQPVPGSTPESTIIIPDTRPIWPGRPELIYRQYLTEKAAWLANNPKVRSVSYRRARGLEIYPYHWIRERRQELPIQRLDLDTETLLEGIADWTNEEVSAWLDWDKIKDQEVERQVEAELVIAGGFGQGRRRSVQSLWNRLEGDIEARNTQYRFADYSIVQ
jgi:hypothetical protein